MDEDDLDSLLAPTHGNLDKLRRRLRELRDDPDIRENVTSELIASRLGLTKSQVDNFMRGRVLGSDAYALLIKYLWDNKWWVKSSIEDRLTSLPDALFYSLCNFLKTGEQTRQNLRREIVGTYRLWRASMHFPGQYLLGKLEIRYDLASRAVHVTEVQKFKGSDLAAEQREVFEGYIVKKSRYFMIIARQSGRHRGAPRMTMIHNALYEGGIVQAMQGVVTGCYGANMMFSAPVYIERVEAAGAETLDDQLDIRFDVPESIKAKLRFHIDGNVIRF